MRIVSVGDNCLDWYLDRQMIYPGGNTLNLAVYMRRLGAEAAYIGQLGDDRPGDIMAAALAAEDVDITHLRRLPGRSGYATIKTIEGERVFQGASPGVTPFVLDQADYAFLAGSDLIHTGDSSYQDDAVARLAAIAPVSFDFSVKPIQFCEPILPAVTYAIFSRPSFTLAEVADLIAWAHGLGVAEVYVTQGEDGSFSSAGDGIHHEPAIPTEAVDTLGAGDSFITGVLFARLSGMSIPEAARNGSALAAATCCGYGAFGRGEPAGDMTIAPDHQLDPEHPHPTE